jgi:hypothetical protein
MKKKQKKPTDAELYRIYLEAGYDHFCEYGGLSEEGKKRALEDWKAQNKEKLK